MLRFLVVSAVSALLLSTTGCGESSPFETVPVTGKVEMADGVAVTGMAIKKITFTPNAIGDEVRSAIAEINEDGSFSLGTMKPEDGAIPGKYSVSVNIYKTYPPSEAERNAVWVCEPAEVEVVEDMEPVTIKVRKSK